MLTSLMPIGDDNSERIITPYVTYILIAINVAVFVFLQLPSDAFTYAFSVIPREIIQNRDIVETLRVGDGAIQLGPGPQPIQLTILSAMFMHGGWGHLGGNLLYLWIFGDNVEHRFGAAPFLLFYLGSGIAATVAQVALDPAGLVPNLGASGAISGVLGAYLVLFPRNRVHVFALFVVVSLPAVLVLGLWIATQYLSGFGAIAATDETGGIAYGAHVGGFVAGALLAFAARALGLGERRSALSPAMARDSPTR